MIIVFLPQSANSFEVWQKPLTISIQKVKIVDRETILASGHRLGSEEEYT
jgi:hypothetical protein